MQWLTAVLAFATTMLIFSIVVSTLVEIVHRIARLRSRGLELMLENLYLRAIKPRLTNSSNLSAEEFAGYVMQNRALTSEEPSTQNGRINKLLGWLVESHKMTDIPVEVFTQKLADKKLIEIADQLSDEVVMDIAQKYETFSYEIATYFERRARVFSIIIAFLVSWMFFVNPYELATTFLKNPQTAQIVADESADTYREYLALVDKVDTISLKTQLSKDDKTALNEAIAELRGEIQQTQSATRELSRLGVPLGWPDSNMVRMCNPIAGENTINHIDGFCKIKLPVFGDVTIPLLFNTLCLILGGLLIGLGAPFWARAVASITATRNVTHKIGEVVSGRSGASKNTYQTMSVANSDEKSLALSTFTLAKNSALHDKQIGVKT